MEGHNGVLQIKLPINKSPCSPAGIANKLGLVLRLCDASRPTGLDSGGGSLVATGAGAAASAAAPQDISHSPVEVEVVEEDEGEIVHFLANNTRAFYTFCQRRIINSSLNRNCYSINLCFHIFIVSFIVAFFTIRARGDAGGSGSAPIRPLTLECGSRRNCTSNKQL